MRVNKNDVELCLRVCEKITNEFGEFTPIYLYPEHKRVVPIVVTVKGLLDNGGIESLLSSQLPGDPNLDLAIEAFKEIGCDEVVKIIQSVQALFPNKQLQENDDERLAYYELKPEELRDRLDSEFWAVSDNIIIALAKHIRLNNLDK